MDEKDDFGFQFDHLQPEKQQADSDETAAPAASPKRLACSCPKCGAELETPFPEESQLPFSATCTSCNSTVSIIRESSANRARRRSRKLSCSTCGNLLDHHIHCTSCGTLFPDYHVAVNPEDVLRKARSKRLANFRHSLGKFNPSLYLDFLHKPDVERRQRRPAAISAPAGTFATPRVLRLAVSLLVISLLVGGIAYAYHVRQQRQLYVENYFKALYGIKTGSDYNFKFCARMASEWKAAQGSAYAPRLSDREKVKADRIRNEVDSLMQQMGDPPGSFSQAHQKLIQLRGAYQKSHDLAASPPDRLQALTAAAGQAESAFTTAAQEVKGSMPEDFREKFEIAKQKYRGMREF